MGLIQDGVDQAVGKKWRLIGTVIALLIAAYIIIALIGGIWPFSVVRGLAKKVVKENAIIQNYEWFYAMKAEIDATRNKAKIAAGTPEEKGIRMVLESMIAEYNAKSNMVTRTLWKADDLPYQIESGVQE